MNDTCRLCPRTRPFLTPLSLAGAALMLAHTLAFAAAWKAPTLASPDAARLAGSWATAQARNAERLGQAPLDQASFILDDVSLKQHRKFAEYSGDISGRWIGAAAFLAPQFPTAFALFPTVMAQLPTYQKGDGHFGADQQLPKLERGHDMPILWGNGRLLIGLVEVYERTGNRQALDAARKLGDYFIATDSVYNREENIRSVGGSYADGFVTCYFSCIEGLVGLAGATKDQRYLVQAKRIAELAFTVKDFAHLHSHGRLCTVRGFSDLYALTGDPHWRNAAERDWQLFTDQFLLPTGGLKEMLEDQCVRDEGCSESDWLRLNLSMWRLTGQGRYLDAAERSLKAHFVYQQFPNGGAGHRMLHQINGQPVAFKGLSEEAWWCCGEHWARALADVACSVVTAHANGLQINLAVDADASVAGPGGTWKAVVRETEEGLRLNLEPPKAVKAEVRLHRPAWAWEGRVEAPSGLTVRRDGEAWVVKGTWRGPQQIRVIFPTAVRAETAGPAQGVLLCRHDLLVAPRSPTNSWLTAQLPSVRPVVLWAAALPQANGRILVPASVVPNPDPSRPEHWHALELTTLRAQAVADPAHEFAWFSFQPRAADLVTIQALLAKLITVRHSL